MELQITQRNWNNNTKMTPRYWPFKCTPTVYPVENFDPTADAASMCKAMKSSGVDEEAIIDVLTNRGIKQRMEIAELYEQHHRSTLVNDLKSKLSGNLGDVVVALMTPLQDYYVRELHDAITGRKTDEKSIIELLCTVGNWGINTVVESYQKQYGRSIEDDLKDDTSGQFKRLIVSICQANRDESVGIDLAQAQLDAKDLYEAGEKQWREEDSRFNELIVTNSYQQLRQLFLEYEKISGDDIEVSIEKAFSGSIKKGLLAFVKCTKSKVGFLTERLHAAMQGLGTKDRILIRIIVLRSEIDLGDIKEAFEKRYGKSLESWISGDTSGDYRKALLSIIN
ncbi:annexin B9-like isoform X2 [Diachasmimorpha longicaudata]|uniref:annexin B9-like isoform X2 n=1 Tax=Diachasmimorpha longicaudata TaxID=58733 RepID=UPI0030B8998E